MILVTEFVTRHDDGPAVTASRRGTSWVFNWPGRNREDSAVLTIDYAAAQKVAQRLAEEVANIEPLVQDLDRRRRDIGEWLESQREPT